MSASYVPGLQACKRSNAKGRPACAAAWREHQLAQSKAATDRGFEACGGCSLDIRVGVLEGQFEVVNGRTVRAGKRESGENNTVFGRHVPTASSGWPHPTVSAQ
jgi:hypothetical protein